MIISKTPFRISLFGGGTDYPAYFNEHGGEVLGFAINKFCYISIRHLKPYFGHKHRIVWSKVELVNEYKEIEHPAAREILKLRGPKHGLEIHHDADIPARSGMGSSSSFTVGLLNALSALKGRHENKFDLAKDAIALEQEVLNENVGCQDQVWAAYGGFSHIHFDPTGFLVHPVVMPEHRKRYLNKCLMLVFTGFSRVASEVAKAQIDKIGLNKSHLKQMKGMVGEALSILQSERDLNELGALLHESWGLKRSLADNVSSGEIDAIYDAGRSAGALGGKLLGAGGGGFMLFYAPPEFHERIRQKLGKLIHVPFQIGALGSQIILYEPNGM